MVIKQVLLSVTILFSFQHSMVAQEATPSAIFTAVFWDRFTSKNITYAPWGNENEVNATKISIQVGFSSPSQPFAYYGTDKVVFYEKKYQFQEQDRNQTQELLTPIGEFDFEPESGVTKNFLLIFLKQQNQARFKIFAISLSQQNLEYGTFDCYSQCKESLYLIFGEQKQILPPGKSANFKRVENGNTEATQFKAFVKKDSKYQEVATEYLALSNESRAILFLSPYRNRIRTKRYYLNRVSLEATIGNGSIPVMQKIMIKEDINATQISVPDF